MNLTHTLDSPLDDDQPTSATDSELTGWLATTAPSRLARRHLLLALGFGLVGGLAAAAIQREWLTPQLDAFEARTFGVLLSLHGTLGVYFLMVPLVAAVMGHTLLLEALGARSVVFPRLARSSWQLLAAGGAVVLAGFVGGGTESGWMFDGELGWGFSAPGVATAALGVLIGVLGISMLATSQVATIVRWRRATPRECATPDIASAFLLAALSALVACACLAALVCVVLLDAVFGLSLFDATSGGDPELFTRGFQFAVSALASIVLLGSLGTVTSVLGTRSDEASGVRTTVTLWILAFTGLFAWVGPTSSPPEEPGSTAVQAVLSALAFASATAMLVSFVRRLWRRPPALDAAGLYAIAYLPTLALGLATSLLVAMPATRVVASRTVLATTHLHWMMFAAPLLAFLAGLHRAWPSLARRHVAEGWARVGAGLVIGGLYATFLPLFVVGFAGQPFRANAYAGELQIPHVFSAAGTTILVAGTVLMVVALIAGPRVETERA